MIKNIKFKGLDPQKSEIDSADGELAACYGCLPKDDGTYGTGITTESVMKLPDGYRAVLIHQVRPYPQLLMIDETVNNGYVNLYHCALKEQITNADIREIGRIKASDKSTLPLKAEIAGHRVVIATEEGIIMLIWDTEYTSEVTGTRSAGYRLIQGLPDAIEIDFGLQKVGNLVGSDVVHTTAAALSNSTLSDVPGSGASRPHATAESDQSETANISKAVMQSYISAVGSQVSSKGFVHQPLYIRYALRLADGSHACASSPLLLLPTVLPPRISVSTNTDNEGKATINIDLSHNQYFELRYRIKDTPSAKWSGIIQAIDIFATAAINTYTDEQDGYITSFQKVLDATDTAGPHRGRVTGTGQGNTGVSPTLAEIFEGHYSIANDNYIDHTLDENIMNARVWYVTPNPHLNDDILNPSEFYRIASIPYSEIKSSTEFRRLAMPTTDAEVLKQRPTLKISDINNEILPTAIKKIGSRIVYGADKYRMSRPMGLSGMTAYTGCATDGDSEPVTISVYVTHCGRTYKTHSESRRHQSTLATQFPRFIFYPDVNATLMTLTQGEHTWILPLTTHNTLNGSYWWGGLDKDFMPTAQTIGDDNQYFSDITEDEATIYISDAESPMILNAKITVGEGKITGICGAKKAPQGGAFGDYPLYALTSSGIWMIKYDDNKGKLTASRKISDLSCTNPSSIAELDGKVGFASTKGIHLIEGSSVKTISKGLEAIKFDVGTLPHSTDILKIADAKIMETTTEELYDECVIYHDTDRDLLIASGKTAMVYSLPNESWTMCDLGIKNKIIGEDALLVDTCNKVSKIAEQTTGNHGLLITRPIKMTNPNERVDVTSIEILGEYQQGHVKTALYGANHLNHWHIIGTSMTGCIDDANAMKYRYHRIIILTRLTPDEYIYGIEIRANNQLRAE